MSSIASTRNMTKLRPPFALRGSKPRKMHPTPFPTSMRKNLRRWIFLSTVQSQILTPLHQQTTMEHRRRLHLLLHLLLRSSPTTDQLRGSPRGVGRAPRAHRTLLAAGAATPAALAILANVTDVTAIS